MNKLELYILLIIPIFLSCQEKKITNDSFKNNILDKNTISIKIQGENYDLIISNDDSIDYSYSINKKKDSILIIPNLLEYLAIDDSKLVICSKKQKLPNNINLIYQFGYFFTGYDQKKIKIGSSINYELIVPLKNDSLKFPNRDSIQNLISKKYVNKNFEQAYFQYKKYLQYILNNSNKYGGEKSSDVIYARKNINNPIQKYSSLEELLTNFLLEKIIINIDNKEKFIYNEIEEDKNPNLSISNKWYGNYKKNVETEATTTGMASITYDFSINKDGVNVKTNTYHEPIRCNGIYTAEEKEGKLNLYYAGEDETCKSDYPYFIMKIENKKIYAQGLGSINTEGEWLELEKQK